MYETSCHTCYEKDKEKIEKEEKDEKERKRKISQIKIYKYVGETSRSIYERAIEHQNDMEQLKPGSHFLKHLVDVHEKDEKENVRFGVKVIQFTRSSFERQVLESVIIQKERHHHLLNSRSEFNRCAIPRLSTKIGDYKKYEKEIEIEREKDEQLEEKIRNMRKERSRGRLIPSQNKPTWKRKGKI